MTDLLGPASAANATTVRPTDSRTFGASDTWFQDCPPGSSVGGTALIASWFNGWMAQLRNAIRGMGVAVGDTNDNMLLTAIQLAGMAPPYGVDTSSTPSAMVVTLSPAPPSFAAGDEIIVKATQPCTGPSTVTPNGIATYNIVHNDERSALVNNDYVVGQLLRLVFDGTNFQLGKNAQAAGSVTAAALAAGAAPPLPAVAAQPSDDLHLSNDTAAATRDVDVSPGRVRDDSDVTNLQLASAMAKRLDTAWAAGGAVGASVGGCDTGTKGNNQTWHAFLIGRLGLAVTTFARSSNVATLGIAAHGLGVGGSIRVVGIGGGFDGLQVITAVPNANSVSFANAGANVATTSTGASADGLIFCSRRATPPRRCQAAGP